MNSNLSQDKFEKIFNYLQNARLSDNTVNKHLSDFEANPDLANEFCEWIDTRVYNTNNPIVIEGYSANDIYSKATYLDGLKVYSLMIKLRNNPERTVKEIENGMLGF